MMKRFVPALALLFSSTGCFATPADHSVETAPLIGNGEAGRLDFLDSLYPIRDNRPLPLVGGTTRMAITRWIDVTACTTQTDFDMGEHEVCPGSPSQVSLRLVSVSCDEPACEAHSVEDTSRPGLVVVEVTTHRASARVRARVEEVATGIVHEDTYVVEEVP